MKTITKKKVPEMVTVRQVPVPEDVHRAFAVKCMQKNISRREVISALICLWALGSTHDAVEKQVDQYLLRA